MIGGWAGFKNARQDSLGVAKTAEPVDPFPSTLLNPMHGKGLWSVGCKRAMERKYANKDSRQGEHNSLHRRVGVLSVIIPEGKHPARISALKVEKRGKENCISILDGSALFQIGRAHV